MELWQKAAQAQGAVSPDFAQQWKGFLEQWYMRADSFLGPEQCGPWVREQVDVMDRLVKEFGLKK